MNAAALRVRSVGFISSAGKRDHVWRPIAPTCRVDHPLFAVVALQLRPSIREGIEPHSRSPSAYLAKYMKSHPRPTHR